MKKFWKRHSLSIVLSGITLCLWTIGAFTEGELHHYFMNLGHATFGCVVLFVFSAKFTEVNKPETTEGSVGSGQQGH